MIFEHSQSIDLCKDLSNDFLIYKNRVEKFLNTLDDQKFNKKELTEIYYNFALELGDLIHNTEKSIILKITSEITRADHECKMDKVNELYILFEMYIAHRNAIDDYLTITHAPIKKFEVSSQTQIKSEALILLKKIHIEIQSLKNYIKEK